MTIACEQAATAAGIYSETVAATAGPGPLALRCDTPGHGDVTGVWSTALADGWDLGNLHPAGLRLCPQCCETIHQDTQDALDRAKAREAATCDPVPDWASRGQQIAWEGLRWAAAAPASRSLPDALYGTCGDTAFLGRLFEECDAWFGRIDHATAAHAPLAAGPGETVPEVPHEDEPGGEDGAPFGELDAATEQHPAVLLDAHGVHDGNTASFPAVAGDAQGQPS